MARKTSSQLVAWIAAISLASVAVAAAVVAIRLIRVLKAAEKLIARCDESVAQISDKAGRSAESLNEVMEDGLELVHDARRKLKRLDSVLDTAENVALNVRLSTLLIQKSLAPSLVTVSSVAAGMRKGLDMVRRVKRR